MQITDLENSLRKEGFIPETINIYRRIVSNYSCPNCGRELEYRGFSTAQRSVTYGVCVPCNHIRRFFEFPAIIAQGKKRFSAAMKY